MAFSLRTRDSRYHTPMSRDRYLDPYRKSADRHGTDFRVTLWANRDAQVKRFEVFAQMCFLPGKRILDAGCSRGDMAVYFIERGIDFAHYVGIDGLPKVIAYAARRELPRCDFIAGDFLVDSELLSIGDPQVICISGSLNTMSDKQVMVVLKAAWAASSEALLFNFLPDLARPEAPFQTAPARRLDALRLIKWAVSRTGLVTYRQDYFKHGHDATIMMVKEGREERRETGAYSP